MSLRDFDTPPSDDPIALHNEPMGNGAGLSTFHTTHPEDREPNNTPKIVGAVAIALMVGAAGLALYANWGPSTKPVVADNSLPKTAPVAPVPQQTAMAAPANSLSSKPNAAAPDAAAPVPEPVTTKTAAKPAPVRTARSARSSASIEATANARMAAAARPTTQVPEPAQVTPVPEQAQATPLPAAPSPSPSDVASNPPAAAPQQPQSSTPQADNAAPAQDQQSGATPAPAQ